MIRFIKENYYLNYEMQYLFLNDYVRIIFIFEEAGDNAWKYLGIWAEYEYIIILN